MGRGQLDAGEVVLVRECVRSESHEVGKQSSLVLTLSQLFAYGTAGMLFALSTWMRTWLQADVVTVVDRPLLICKPRRTLDSCFRARLILHSWRADITFCSFCVLLTSLLGLAATLLHSRPLLAVYCLLLWPCGVALLSVGYSSYRKSHLSLDLKINEAWSRLLDDAARLQIQDAVSRAGALSPFQPLSNPPLTGLLSSSSAAVLRLLQPVP